MTCTKCQKQSQIGSKFAWGWDGYHYCSNCLAVSDKEFKEQFQKPKENIELLSLKKKKK